MKFIELVIRDECFGTLKTTVNLSEVVAIFDYQDNGSALCTIAIGGYPKSFAVLSHTYKELTSMIHSC